MLVPGRVFGLHACPSCQSLPHTLPAWLIILPPNLEVRPLSVTLSPPPPHVRRLRHIEICGTWEGCCWEGGITGFVMGLLPPAAAGEAAEAAGAADEGGQPQAGGAAIAGPWGPVQLGVVDDPHDTNDEAGEEEAEGRRTGLIQGGSYLTAGVAAGSRQTLHLPTWLTRQLAAAGLWQRLLLDGWHAMPCFQSELPECGECLSRGRPKASLRVPGAGVCVVMFDVVSMPMTFVVFALHHNRRLSHLRFAGVCARACLETKTVASRAHC